MRPMRSQINARYGERRERSKVWIREASSSAQKGDIECNDEGRDRVAFDRVAFIRIPRSEATLIRHYRPCAEYEMKTDAPSSRLFVIPSRERRSGFLEWGGGDADRATAIRGE